MDRFLYYIKRALTGKFTMIPIIILSPGAILSAFISGVLLWPYSSDTLLKL